MPLFKQINTNNLHLAIWKIDESLEMLKAIDLTEDCKQKVKRLKKVKDKKAFLSVRHLLSQILIPLSELYYQNNRPFLLSGKYISITHTDSYSAVGISREKIGLDLERVSAKTLYVKEKFLNEDEIKMLKKNETRELSTKCWCAKESVFKGYKKDGVSLKKHITLKNISAEIMKATVQGGIFEKAHYKVCFIQFSDHIFSYAIENAY